MSNKPLILIYAIYIFPNVEELGDAFKNGRILWCPSKNVPLVPILACIQWKVSMWLNMDAR